MDMMAQGSRQRTQVDRPVVMERSSMTQGQGQRQKQKEKSMSIVTTEWMTLRELSGIAGVTPQTLRMWIKREDNPLPALTIERTWRVHKEDWIRWAKENSNTA